MLVVTDEAVEVSEPMLQLYSMCVIVEQCKGGDELVGGIEDVHAKLL